MHNNENELDKTASEDALLHRANTRFLEKRYEDVILDCNNIIKRSC